jgi:hypothetical protein
MENQKIILLLLLKNKGKKLNRREKKNKENQNLEDEKEISSFLEQQNRIKKYRAKITESDFEFCKALFNALNHNQGSFFKYKKKEYTITDKLLETWRTQIHWTEKKIGSRKDDKRKTRERLCKFKRKIKIKEIFYPKKEKKR